MWQRQIRHPVNRLVVHFLWKRDVYLQVIKVARPIIEIIHVYTVPAPPGERFNKDRNPIELIVIKATIGTPLFVV